MGVTLSAKVMFADCGSVTLSSEVMFVGYSNSDFICRGNVGWLP